MTFLAWRGVSVRYPKATRDALRDIDLELDLGAHALLGAHGSGKSTLLQSACGLTRTIMGAHLSGTITFDGADLAHYSPHTIADYLGLVCQDPSAQTIGRTCFEQVALGLRTRGFSRSQIFTRAAECLEQVGLGAMADHAVDSLSGGQKQRLTIASALAVPGQMLLLDNITAQIDPEGSRQIRQVIAQLRSTGLGTVWSGYDAGVFDDETVTILHQGGVEKTGITVDQMLVDLEACARWGIRPTPLAIFNARLNQLHPIDMPTTLTMNVDLDHTVAHVRRHLGSHDLGRVAAYDVAVQPTSMNLGEVVVAVDDLCFAYGGHDVLKGASFELRQGECVVLAGKNGAGKTTLAMVCNGLLAPGSGRIVVRGRDITDQPTWLKARQIAYLFQNPDDQIFCRTVADEVGFAVYRNQMADANDAVSEALEICGITRLAEAHPLSLDPPERRLVALASIIARRPQVIIADEPTAGCDASLSQQIMQILTGCARQGTAVLIISHDEAMASQYAHRILVLDDGVISLEGTPAQILDTDIARLQKRLGLADFSSIDPEIFAQTIAYAASQHTGGR